MNIRGKTTLKAVLTAYDDHLHQTCGLCAGTRRGYRECVRRFLEATLPGPRIALGDLDAKTVLAYIEKRARHLKPRSVKLYATSLRSFFRFLRTRGMATEALEHAVPSIPEWRLSTLPRGLSEEDLKRFLASLDTSTPRRERDRAMILCLARLGLRAGEVADLELADIDWRAGTLRIRRRKSRREAILPLPPDVGRAITDYLRGSRAKTRTTSRRVFVRLRQGVGEPIGSLLVTQAVRYALRDAGMEAPSHGAHLLRHTLATRMVNRGTPLKEIADVLGHTSLATTAIYAKVDVASLSEVPLPWPETAS